MATLLSFVDLFFDFAQVNLLHFFFFLYFVNSGLIFLFLVEQPRKLPKFIWGLLIPKLLQFIGSLLVFRNPRIDCGGLLWVLIIRDIWRIWNHGMFPIVSLNIIASTFSNTTLPVESIFIGMSTFLSFISRDNSYGLMFFCLFFSICFIKELENTTWKGVDL